MNLKIQKFAEGGASSSAFFYQPLAMASTGVEADTDMSKLIKALTAANKKSSSDDEKGKMTDKDFLALLKEVDGLPSDIVKLYREAQTYWAEPTITGDTNYSNFGQLLTKISLQAKIAKFNKEVWTKSRDTMFSNHSENEMAITDQGGVVVETKDGGMNVISVDTWKKNPYAYKTLTNADIMELRAQKIPGNNAILNIVNGSTSMDAITEKLQKVISNAKSSNVESYISTDGFNTKAGLNVLKQLAQRGLDPSTLTMAGVYKYTNKENADQVANLLSYAWGSLSTRERTLLSARAGRDGKGPDQLLKMLALGNTSFDVQMDYQDSLNQDGTKKETSKSSTSKSDAGKDWQDVADANQAYMIQTGRGGTPVTYSFQPQNGGAQMNLYGRFFGGLMKTNGEIVGKTSIESLLQQTGLQTISNTKSIYFGNKKVDDISRVAYLNSGGYRVILPAIKDSLGNIAPNFAVMKAWEKAQKKINSLNPKDPMYLKKQAQIISEDPNLQSLLINGRPNPNKFASFIVVDGETDENNIGDGLKYAVALKSGDDEYDALADILYPSTGSSKSTHTKEVPGVHFWGNDKLYKAPVFIPITSQNPSDSLILSSKFNVEQTKQLGDLAAAKQAPMQSSSSSLLNN